MAKRASFGNMVLKKLSDITNVQSVKIATEEKPPEISDIDKDYVDQLIKERRNLLKLIAERNHIIELTGAELQKFRVNLQKLQLQNWNLAQSNSQMIAEVNYGRERVKSLQHELMCKEALLKANSFGNKGKTTGNSGKTVPQVGDFKEGDETNEAERPQSQNKRRIVRSRSMGPSTSTRSQKAEDKERVESKRRCLKRQSARFKREQPDNYFEIEDTKFAPDDKNENDYKETSNFKEEEEEMGVRGRSSIGRPLRRAAGKIQSYKEVPLNIKMRRER